MKKPIKIFIIFFTITTNVTIYAQNVGIGIANPTTAKLQIGGTAGQQGIDLSTADQYANMRVIQNTHGVDKDLYLGFLSGATSSLHLYSNNLELLTLKGGKVGINNASPNNVLTVNGMADFNNFVGIGVTTPHAPIHLATATNSRKIILKELDNNENQFDGFGILSGQLIYQSESSSLDHVFYSAINATSSKELMRIKGNGSIGIGTTSPAFTLDVKGTIQLSDTQDATSGNVGIGRSPQSNVKAAILSNQNYGLTVDGINSQYSVYVGGSAFKADGSPFWTTLSDKNLKEQIHNYEGGLANILKMNPVRYHYTKASKMDTSAEKVGFLAQDLQNIAPEMVLTKKDFDTKQDQLHVNLSPILFMYVNAIKELDAENKANKTKIADLEARLARLEGGR